MLVDATYKDLVSDPIAGQAMHPHSAEASGKQTNSGELSFKEITTLLSVLVDCDPGAIPKLFTIILSAVKGNVHH